VFVAVSTVAVCHDLIGLKALLVCRVQTFVFGMMDKLEQGVADLYARRFVANG